MWLWSFRQGDGYSGLKEMGAEALVLVESFVVTVVTVFRFPGHTFAERE
jgi:hypothetical protein